MSACLLAKALMASVPLCWYRMSVRCFLGCWLEQDNQVQSPWKTETGPSSEAKGMPTVLHKNVTSLSWRFFPCNVTHCVCTRPLPVAVVTISRLRKYCYPDCVCCEWPSLLSLIKSHVLCQHPWKTVTDWLLSLQLRRNFIYALGFDKRSFCNLIQP